jgi:hypothetical protein
MNVMGEQRLLRLLRLMLHELRCRQHAQILIVYHPQAPECCGTIVVVVDETPSRRTIRIPRDAPQEHLQWPIEQTRRVQYPWVSRWQHRVRMWCHRHCHAMARRHGHGFQECGEQDPSPRSATKRHLSLMTKLLEPKWLRKHKDIIRETWTGAQTRTMTGHQQ